MRRSPAQKPKQIVIELPLLQNAAIYTLGQTQAEKLLQLAYSYGYTEEQVCLFLDGEAPEAPLQGRESYQALMQAIRERNITVIFLPDIARVFAEASQEELDSFIHLGMSRGIFVVTPQGIFSFSHLTLIVAFRAIAAKCAAPTSARNERNILETSF